MFLIKNDFLVTSYRKLKYFYHFCFLGLDTSLKKGKLSFHLLYLVVIGQTPKSNEAPFYRMIDTNSIFSTSSQVSKVPVGCDLTTHQLLEKQTRVRYFTSFPKGRRLVISDIHGCIKTFRALVEKLGLNKDDHLFLLGDYINKGKDSAGVLDFIFELQKTGFQVFPLMGNHEFNVVDTAQRYNSKTFQFFVRKNKAGNLLDTNGKIKPHYFEFFESLMYRFELPDFHLIHAGFDCRKDDPFTHYLAMLEVRRIPQNLKKLNNKRVIHGHQPVYLEEIEQAIAKNLPAIPLDNGACYARKKHKILNTNQLGKLVGLNLDNLALTLQDNLDN